tara:strand:+ start:341 stop:565 length:225 start_codon:yes stop_codon:yes gene_type:complete
MWRKGNAHNFSTARFRAGRISLAGECGEPTAVSEAVLSFLSCGHEVGHNLLKTKNVLWLFGVAKTENQIVPPIT